MLTVNHALVGWAKRSVPTIGDGMGDDFQNGRNVKITCVVFATYCRTPIPMVGTAFGKPGFAAPYGTTHAMNADAKLRAGA